MECGDSTSRLSDILSARCIFHHEPGATTFRNISFTYNQVSTMFLKATKKKTISLEDNLDFKRVLSVHSSVSKSCLSQTPLFTKTLYAHYTTQKLIPAARDAHVLNDACMLAFGRKTFFKLQNLPLSMSIF